MRFKRTKTTEKSSCPGREFPGYRQKCVRQPRNSNGHSRAGFIWFVLLSFLVVVVVVLHFEGDTDVLRTFHKLVWACCLPQFGLFCYHVLLLLLLLLLFYTFSVIQMC